MYKGNTANTKMGSWHIGATEEAGPLQRPTHLSLFTGIGGIDLAADMAGFETVGQCEIDAFCLRVLEKHWPNVERWTDVRELTWQSLLDRGVIHSGTSPGITLLSGGFP